jgi:hypothetical protein
LLSRDWEAAPKGRQIHKAVALENGCVDRRRCEEIGVIRTVREEGEW